MAGSDDDRKFFTESPFCREHAILPLGPARGCGDAGGTVRGAKRQEWASRRHRGHRPARARQGLPVAGRDGSAARRRQGRSARGARPPPAADDLPPRAARQRGRGPAPGEFELVRLWVRRLKGGLSVEQPIAGDELRAIRRYLATRADALPWLFISERSQPMTRQAVNYLVAAAAARGGEMRAEIAPDQWRRRRAKAPCLAHRQRRSRSSSETRPSQHNAASKPPMPQITGQHARIAALSMLTASNRDYPRSTYGECPVKPSECGMA
jgi:hypothetical protein